MIKRTYFMSAKKHTKVGYDYNYTQYVVRSWFANHTSAFYAGIDNCMKNFEDVEGNNVLEVVCFTRL